MFAALPEPDATPTRSSDGLGKEGEDSEISREAIESTNRCWVVPSRKSLTGGKQMDCKAGRPATHDMHDVGWC